MQIGEYCCCVESQHSILNAVPSTIGVQAIGIKVQAASGVLDLLKFELRRSTWLELQLEVSDSWNSLSSASRRSACDKKSRARTDCLL